MGSERGDEHKKPCSLGEGTASKEADNSEAPQRATASRLVPTHQGACAHNPKAKLGHSRDHRSDCKQLVVGLVLNRDGFALTHEIFAGNTRDHLTLGTMIDRLGQRVELKEDATVVVDRGMAFDDNLAEIKARKLHYIVASRQPERNRWLAEFEDTDGFTPVLREPSPLNPA